MAQYGLNTLKENGNPGSVYFQSCLFCSYGPNYSLGQMENGDPSLWLFTKQVSVCGPQEQGRVEQDSKIRL